MLQDLRNWITNLNFPKTRAFPHSDCKHCFVHEGFYAAWESVKDPVLDRVLQLQAETKTAEIFVTGHSLGAALAVLAATEAR